jgi:hypothetical protein
MQDKLVRDNLKGAPAKEAGTERGSLPPALNTFGFGAGFLFERDLRPSGQALVG